MLRIRMTAAAAVLSAALGLAALAAGNGTANAAPAPASPQPAAAALKPGLDVRYWPYDMHSINDLERMVKSGGGNKGAPLPGLNYDDGTDPVLTSNLRQQVGAEITGFIKFPQSGKYQIAANSNDGVRVFIGGDKVTEDPGIHAMGTSPTGEITVEGGVWYPLRILYFQRNGTWGLQLLWAPAGQEDLKVVPADALARVEGPG